MQTIAELVIAIVILLTSREFWWLMAGVVVGSMITVFAVVGKGVL